MVYEINSAELALQMRGVSALNHWTIGLQIACVADSVDSVCDMIDAVLSEFNAGPVDSATNSVSISVSSFSVGFTTEMPDDGKHDAERVGTITMNLLVQED
jgi:pyruvate/oxaloacetate carboxyltransferase